MPWGESNICALMNHLTNSGAGGVVWVVECMPIPSLNLSTAKKINRNKQTKCTKIKPWFQTVGYHIM
jgi:hypothetical protein